MANINQQLAETFNAMADGLMSGQFGKKLRIGLTLIGSEHGSQELLRGAQMVARQYSDIEPVLIGCDGPIVVSNVIRQRICMSATR